MESSEQQLSPIWQNLPVELVFQIFDQLIKMSLDHIGTDPFYPWRALRQVHRHIKHRIEREYRRVLFPRLLVINQLQQYLYSQHRHTVESIRGSPLWNPYIDEQAEKASSTCDSVTFYVHGFENIRRRRHLGNHHQVAWERPRLPYIRPYVHVCLLLKTFTLELALEGARAFRETSMETSLDRVAVRFNAVKLIDALLKEWERRCRRLGDAYSTLGEGWLESTQDAVEQCYFSY